jgi:putative membrane protein
VFIVLLPFGVIPEFSNIGESLTGSYPSVAGYFVWMAIPFSMIISWVFHTMQRIGVVGENPFEGTANDIPISTIARGIEIDLREINGENDSVIPKPLQAVHGVQL